MTVTRLGCAAAVFTTAVMWSCAPALAISPPVVDPGVKPPSGAPGPVQPVERRAECSSSAVMPGTDPGVTTPNQVMLNLPAAWRLSRGEGQLVAIIDTGVRPGPRLPNVVPGGDYVETTDGLTDCDGHGTLVAGLVAGQPGDDGFSGVAPAAQVLSLRAASGKFMPKIAGGDPMLAQASADVAALARAIVHAADRGARVINISTVTCLPADRGVNQAELGAAIRYAAVDKDAVIVAAAGNTGTTGSFGGATPCESNPLTDLSRPDDPRNWSGVTSVSIPSWWQPYVLSVASLTPEAQPSKFTMVGPWVGIAAPGENIVSVSNRDDGGLANALPNDKQQLVPLNGTSYAAGYVAGVAALVRSKYPQLTAAQVVQRITATAHNAARAPSNLVGAGTVDPVAALTWELPASGDSHAPAVKQLAAPSEPAPKDPTPRVVAFTGTAVLALVVVVVAAIAAHRRKEPTP
ncbi:type VII secretion-associated serine protease mycosin [Mycobacterium heckeshornense]|uniref:Type VII secretion-associated serine protease n=1 Tax=Mycobacterium heckeshornense TaxID=110505 RepID=A0A2G8BBZ0_9MYCO|nr:type VII secretion-associated serine protease mycosin [Mycobacterium heckeshornense]KMV16822.1 peptidase [Mycobacterium heckeshornense]MCV7035954.1 type VII secretion-associated serine protease mycosin [Mycobacterium heckeshornense]PIJ35244.1 type VII secretion-associated serine protease mycosin [Mycobacterium heckeshornense]BCO38104.1 type VII secretion-associated serine protease [Mycobacterium heckeshornense]